MNKKTTGILSYCYWIGWLIAFLAGDKEGAKFDLNQGLVLAIASFASDVITGILSKINGTLGGIVGAVLHVAVLVLMIMGLINAINEKEVELPVIGSVKILK